VLLGLSWGALALLLAFWFLSSTELAIMPRSGATIGDLLAQAVAATAGDVSEFRGLVMGRCARGGAKRGLRARG
jgi:hypothetical protein